MMTISESNMTFGPFPKKDCFDIENSKIYQQIQQNVKMVEFLLLHDSAVWVIEAKSSAPNPQNNSQERFDEYLEEMREKFTNALMLGVAVCLKRHPNAHLELPDSFKTLDLATANFKLVLVINGKFEDKWLAPYQDALPKKLRTTVKTLALPPNAVVVLNETGAREHGLIT